MAQHLLNFEKVAVFIENEILNGNLKAEDKVPSTNEFSKAMNINPATAGKGLNLLVDEGILYKKRGLGMFVSPDGFNLVTEKRKSDFFKRRVPAFVKEARRLSVDHQELARIIEEEYRDENSESV